MIKFSIIFLLYVLASLNLESKYQEKVKLGIDLVIENEFSIFKNKRISILSNITGVTSEGKLTIEEFLNTKNINLVSLFTPEHGFNAAVPAGKHVPSDSLYGIPCYSLYGTNRRPQKYQLANTDIIIVDIQDIGIRSYTYISTIYKMMDACAEFGKEVFILDRPNPLGGLIVDGNTLDAGMDSFVGIIPVSYIHGCTIGELANMINEEGWLTKNSDGERRKCKLSIIKMENWKREMQWEKTGLKWIPTSPNIPTVNAIRGAAATGIFGELGIFQIGIGGSLPFQFIGKVDLEDLERLSGKMEFNGMNLCKYNSSKYMGVKINFDMDEVFMPYTNGIKIFLAIRKVYPELFISNKIQSTKKAMFEKVTGTKKIFELLFHFKPDFEILNAINKGKSDYLEIRKKYLLYD